MKPRSKKDTSLKVEDSEGNFIILMDSETQMILQPYDYFHEQAREYFELCNLLSVHNGYDGTFFVN